MLIESGGLRRRPRGTGPLDDEKVERAFELIAWCEGAGIPTALWETSLRRRIETPISLMNKIDHVFVADPELVRALTQDLGGQRPAQLPLAAQLVPEEVPGFDERERQIVFPGSWASWFKGAQREQLEMILEVASHHGLVIFKRETDREDYQLPERFSPFTVPVSTDRRAVRQFRTSRLVIAHDPRQHGRVMVPQITFDALAAGSVAIAPNNLGMRRLLNYIVLRLETRDEAEQEIERLLENEKEWTKQSSRSRASVLHSHTYSHRIATMASAAGYRLLPEPEREAALAVS
jgi:hypothetical protein